MKLTTICPRCERVALVAELHDDSGDDVCPGCCSECGDRRVAEQLRLWADLIWRDPAIGEGPMYRAELLRSAARRLDPDTRDER